MIVGFLPTGRGIAEEAQSEKIIQSKIRSSKFRIHNAISFLQSCYLIICKIVSFFVQCSPTVVYRI